MGMEGKLRRVSEFELAAYRKNPAKLYSELFPSSPSTLSDFGKMTSLMQKAQQSPLGLRIRERALAGEPAIREDVEAFQRELQDLMKGFPQLAKAMEDGQPGLSKDKKQLSLHKSWSCLHYLFTGKAWETDNSVLGKAIVGGVEIPDVNKVMGYGPVKYLLPSEIREVHEALQAFPIATKAAEFDPEKAKAAEVYVPGHEAEELREYFDLLVEFYGHAAAEGEAVLQWVD
jgi:hypothetical protein